jgi:UDP-N-acetylmuramyl pentapeptide phosphotransferase/UDP-N-acetylglucosamine-1-phosphate transferase
VPVNYLFSAIIILFLLGLIDDLIGISAIKRIFVQIVSGIIIVILGNSRIIDLNSLGIDNLNYYTSITLSMILFVFLTNAFNLIDGVNGLLSSIIFIVSFSFSILFYICNEMNLFILSTILFSSNLGFLIFNFGNAKIFMGSCGSYFIASLIFIMSISFINLNHDKFLKLPKLSIILSFCIIPIYDTLRVIILRIAKGGSPFIADSNHIHHVFLKLKFTHSKIVFILISVNIFLIIFNSYFNHLSDLLLIAINFSILIFLNIWLNYYIKKV